MNYRQEKANNGIRYLFSVYQHLNHNADVVDYLKTPDYLASITAKVEAGDKYFEALVDKYLLNNPHVLRLAMVPVLDHFKKSQEKEDTFLEESSSKLTSEQKEEIIRLNKELEDEQNNVDKEKEQRLTELLPGLQVEDIRREKERLGADEYQLDGVGVQWLDVNTNGITYLRMKFSLDNMSDMHRKYISLLCEILPRVGSEQRDYREMSEKLNLCSTNLDLSYHSYLDHNNDTKAHLCLSISCLDDNFSQMSSLLAELLSTPQFDDLENLYNLVKQMNSQNISNLTESSMSVAMEVAAANVSHSCSRVNALEDLKYLYTICQQIQNNGQ